MLVSSQYVTNWVLNCNVTFLKLRLDPALNIFLGLHFLNSKIQNVDYIFWNKYNYIFIQLRYFNLWNYVKISLVTIFRFYIGKFPKARKKIF